MVTHLKNKYINDYDTEPNGIFDIFAFEGSVRLDCGLDLSEMVSLLTKSHSWSIHISDSVQPSKVIFVIFVFQCSIPL